MALKSMRANPGEDRVQSDVIIIIKISRSYPRSVISTILPRAHPSTAPVLIPLPFNHKCTEYSLPGRSNSENDSHRRSYKSGELFS